MDVSRLMKLDVFKSAEILAGEEGVSRKILNVTLIDAPDGYNWYRDGEFIVTTGYAFTNNVDWQDGLLNFIEKLAERNCSGIGIKLKRYIPFIPKQVIDYANKNKLPIISIPNEPSWTDFIVPAVTEINKQQKQELEMTHKVYKQFHNHLKENGKLNELANLLESIIKLPITIYIRDFNKIVNTDSSTFKRTDIENIISDVFSGINQPIQTVNLKNKKFTVRWIYSSDRLVGAVFVWGLSSNINAWKKAALEETTIITAVEIERLRTISNTYQHFRNDFLEVLLEETNLQREVISRRAKEVNWDLEDHYKVVVLDYDIDHISTNIDLPISQSILNMLNDFKNELRWLMPKTLIGLDSQNRLALLIADDLDERVLIYNLKRVIKTVNITTFYGGIGRFKNVENVSSSYKEAILALKVAHANESNNLISEKQLLIRNFTNLDVERILFSEDPKAESENLVTEYLQKIIDYDQLKDSEILTTLKMFINNDANFDTTADAMFIHKNTVRYRINKIQKLTNLDPGNMKDLLLLQLAITALSLKKAKR